MSKRAEELAKQLYPDPKLEDYDDILIYRADRDNAIMGKSNVICVYEQAEKGTIERASEWFRTHWREYIMGPDADGCVGFGHWENDFRKAMEKE